ncbi:MAG: AMP-binding protein [Candidatus Moranbacteria bacterium]|nr:AMP-binding protein [Candidatus Moranbacteria bacterium]
MSSPYQKFRQSALKRPANPAIKYRNKKKWRGRNYGSLLSLVDNLAVSLRDLGVKPADRLIIYSENRPEWLITDLAINSIQAISVPVHAVAMSEYFEFVARDSGASYLFISSKLYRKNLKIITKHTQFRYVIVIGKASGSKNSKTLSFKQLVKSGKNLDLPSKPARPSAIATIVYTSGTTGKPKGVMLTNQNLVSNIHAVTQRIKIYHSDVFLSFLPLSHILERNCGSNLPMARGACIAYAKSPKTVTQDLSAIQPSVLISVPKIYERVYEAIFSQIKKKPKPLRKLFYWAVKDQPTSWRQKLACFLVLTPLKNKIFGYRLRFSVSGGASINKNILKFFKKIQVNIVEGYGLTETSPIISVNGLKPEQAKIATVGQAIKGVKVKINPDKEIIVKGPNVMKGYWNQTSLTQQAFSNGWFKTGDLGFQDDQGFLTIIGRRKEIIVTNNGKNIAPEKIENLLNLNPLIQQSIVVGHRKKFLTALIHTGEPTSRNIKKSKAAVQKAINKINQQLEPHEQIRRFKIITQPFSIEKGELTPTLKIRRKIIEANYKNIIEKMYSNTKAD